MRIPRLLGFSTSGEELRKAAKYVFDYRILNLFDSNRLRNEGRNNVHRPTDGMIWRKTLRPSGKRLHMPTWIEKLPSDLQRQHFYYQRDRRHENAFEIFIFGGRIAPS